MKYTYLENNNVSPEDNKTLIEGTERIQIFKRNKKHQVCVSPTTVVSQPNATACDVFKLKLSLIPDKWVIFC